MQTESNYEFEFPLFHDLDYESYEILNKICSFNRFKDSDFLIIKSKKLHTKTLKFNSLIKKRSNSRRLPNYIQYFLLYIFSIVPNINKNDYIFVTILVCVMFKNDLSKFDYLKIVEHFKNIRNKIKYYIRRNLNGKQERIIKELFDYSVFYDSNYYLKCLKNFKHRNPNNNLIIPKINDEFYVYAIKSFLL